jgi:hypothetical protein
MSDKPEKKKKRTLRERWNDALGGLSREDVYEITRDTLDDLRRPKEVFALVASSFIPGGWIGYGAYRVHKYRKKKAANDNKSPKKPGPDAPKP